MLRLSNSQTELFMHSERCYWWRYIQRLSLAVYGLTDMNWGRHIHEALEKFYVFGTVESALKDIDMTQLEVAEASGDWHTPGRMRLLVEDYVKEYDDDFEILSIEDDAEVPLSDDVLWVGKHDLVIRDASDGLIYILDHKTTRKKVDGSMYAGLYNNDQQMTSYHWMGQQLYGDEFGGIRINAIQATKTIQSNFARFPASRDDWQIEEFKANMKVFAPRIKECRVRGGEMLREGLTEQSPEVVELFPQRRGYSENFCDYRHINNAPPEIRDSVITEMYTQYRK